MAREWNRRTDRYESFMKYSLIVINVLSFICGLVAVILGIWTIASRFFANHLLGTNLYTGAAYILTITGFFVILISCLGCLGAVKEVRCILVIYSTILFIIFVTTAVGAILAYVFRDKVLMIIRIGMESSLRDYGNYKPITDAWDETQTRLRCCGIYDYRDWQDRIPQSCCKLTGVGVRIQCQSLGVNNQFTIFTEGCLDVVKEFVRSQAAIIGTAGMVVSCVMVLGMIFSCTLFRLIR